MKVFALVLLLILVVTFLCSIFLDWGSLPSRGGGLRTTSSSRVSNDSPFMTPPSIVILPGPHKTASTSIQHCMVQWTHLRNHKVDKQYISNWTWAIPSEKDMKQIHLNPMDQRKRFAPLLAVLRHSHKFDLIPTGKNDTTTIDKDQVLKVYRNAISDAWDDGENIVLGTEGMDYMINPYMIDRNVTNMNSTEIMEGIIDILPWDHENRPLDMKKDVEVVIMYRAPRMDHLISIWHQFGEENESISDFFMSPMGLEDMSMSNSLDLALRFLQRGIPTTIVDMSGVSDIEHHEKFGMCQVVACDIFRVDECEQKHHHIKTIDADQSDSHLNSKHGNGIMDLSDEQLSSINVIMNRYDCSLQSSLLEYHHLHHHEKKSEVTGESNTTTKNEQVKKQPLLRILYSNELFRHCYPEIDDYDDVSFTWMVEEIQKVISSS